VYEEVRDEERDGMLGVSSNGGRAPGSGVVEVRGEGPRPGVGVGVGVGVCVGVAAFVMVIIGTGGSDGLDGHSGVRGMDGSAFGSGTGTAPCGETVRFWTEGEPTLSFRNSNRKKVVMGTPPTHTHTHFNRNSAKRAMW